MTSTRTSLWRHRDFLKLWAGETISLVGTQVTQLALPLTAALVLGATPEQMGLLGAVQFAPFVLFGLFAGVWVDRVRRRPILVWTDVGRAALLGTVPAAAWLGALGFWQLCVVAFLVGVLTVLFDVAYQSFLPSLVGREQLVEGNSKLSMSQSVAQIAGPGLGGLLVQLVTAPFALLLDAVSFLLSALCVGLIRAPEAAPAGGERRSVWGEIGEGLGLVLKNPVLRGIAACTATSNLFGSAGLALWVLYFTREMGIEPALVGVVFAGLGPGALVGAVVAGRAARRIGLGATLVVAIATTGAGELAIALVEGGTAATVPLLTGATFLVGLGGTAYNVNQVSLRQAITPDHLLGRMNATMRFVVWGTIPVGSLAGGMLGGAIGLRPTLIVAGVGGMLAFAWLVLSPAGRLRDARGPAGG